MCSQSYFHVSCAAFSGIFSVTFFIKRFTNVFFIDVTFLPFNVFKIIFERFLHLWKTLLFLTFERNQKTIRL